MRESKLNLTASGLIGDRSKKSNNPHSGYSGEALDQIYRLIAENSSEGIFLATEFKLVYANPAFFKIIGITDLKGKNLLELVDKEDAKRIFYDVQKALKGELSEAGYEVRLKRSDGRWIHLSLSMSKVIFKEKPHALGIIRDISDRKNGTRTETL
jgi:PAS domain S-box-containing protein